MASLTQRTWELTSPAERKPGIRDRSNAKPAADPQWLLTILFRPDSSERASVKRQGYDLVISCIFHAILPLTLHNLASLRESAITLKPMDTQSYAGSTFPELDGSHCSDCFLSYLMKPPWKDFWGQGQLPENEEKGIDLGDIFCRVDMTAKGGINSKSPLPAEEYILREVSCVAMAGWEVMPTPIWSNYLGRELQKIECHWTLISELAQCGNYYFSERPRSPMATRGATPAGRGTSPSRRHDTGSHSVDRIVRIILVFI